MVPGDCKVCRQREGKHEAKSNRWRKDFVRLFCPGDSSDARSRLRNWLDSVTGHYENEATGGNKNNGNSVRYRGSGRDRESCDTAGNVSGSVCTHGNRENSHTGGICDAGEKSHKLSGKNATDHTGTAGIFGSGSTADIADGANGNTDLLSESDRGRYDSI